MAETLSAGGLPRTVVDNVSLAPVHLNVGGTTYTTTLTTLTKFPDSKLAKLFNGTLAITVDPDNRHYFLDVDGSVFNHILNFLRYEKLVLPEDFKQLPLLIEQAEFFELEAMLSALTTKNTSEEDSGTEVEQEQQRRRRRRRNIDKKELVGAGEDPVTGEGEGETGGGGDMVIMDVYTGAEDNFNYMNLFSTSELSLEEPLPEYTKLQPVSVGVGYQVDYILNPLDSDDEHIDPDLIIPITTQFCKQLLDRGYKLVSVTHAGTCKHFYDITYFFTRVK